MHEKALIFNVQRYSIHDGPGIRTLIFLKGCPLHCMWCSNPEGISPNQQVKYLKNTCIGCGRCLEICPHNAIFYTEEDGFGFDADKCTHCGRCVAECPVKARIWWGREVTVEELYNIVKRDAAFFRASGGGVTLGGGDPLLQHEFALAFLKKCKENAMNTAIETEGYCTFETLQSCAAYCDTIHLDVKAWNEETHKKYTGVSNQPILSNLRKLDLWISETVQKPRLIVRMPFLPEQNFLLSEMDELAYFFRSLKNLTYVEILPFHNLGEHKYAQTGLPYAMKDLPNLTAGDVAEYAARLRAHGVVVKVTEW